jgi:putative glutamine amidotransferase
MTMPLIGIEVDLEANAKGRRYAKCYETYFDAISAAGGAPLLVPPMPRAQAELVLSRLHGLVVPGGDDFAAEDWGDVQRPCPRFTPSDARRLTASRQLIQVIIERRLPFLGVCYGAQLLNLALGGTMHQDIPDELPDALTHSGPEHTITVEPDSLLAELLGSCEVTVNSRHHQANLLCGEGLRVSARAPDGVVEAIEASDRSGFLLGVQWHPEELAGPSGAHLFEGLVEAARAAMRVA